MGTRTMHGCSTGTEKGDPDPARVCGARPKRGQMGAVEKKLVEGHTPGVMGQ